MPEFLKSVAGNGALQIAPSVVGVRLLIAFVMGLGVAWVYRHARPVTEQTASFPPTLVLMCILIAMVTQVVGDNIARAFSLVGALSIVRFRTVVRDTQDTAFVIFAVVVGMAVGAGSPWVAGLGGLTVTVAAFVMVPARVRRATSEQGAYAVRLRTGLGTDVKVAIDAAIVPHVIDRRLVAIATAKQGLALDITYEVRFKDASSPDALIKDLNRVEGIQSVEINLQGVEVEEP